MKLVDMWVGNDHSHWCIEPAAGDIRHVSANRRLVVVHMTFRASSACRAVDGAMGTVTGKGNSLRTARLAAKAAFLDWQRQSERYFAA